MHFRDVAGATILLFISAARSVNIEISIPASLRSHIDFAGLPADVFSTWRIDNFLWQS